MVAEELDITRSVATFIIGVLDLKWVGLMVDGCGSSWCYINISITLDRNKEQKNYVPYSLYS